VAAPGRNEPPPKEIPPRQSRIHHGDVGASTSTQGVMRSLVPEAVADPSYTTMVLNNQG